MTGKNLGTGAAAPQPLEIKREAGGARIRQPMLLPPSSANRLLPSSETAGAARDPTVVAVPLERMTWTDVVSSLLP